MRNSEQNVVVKVELWKEINGYINKIEEKYSFFFTILVTFFGGLIVFCKGNLISYKAFDFNFFVLWFLPIALAVIMAYLAYNFRAVAIARMYASAIEKSINKDLEETVFTWNSHIINNFFAKRNPVNTKLLPFVNSILFISILVFIVYSMWNSYIHDTIKIAYYIFVFLLFCFCLIPFFDNESIRTYKYKFN